jgi:hypothetical protein
MHAKINLNPQTPNNQNLNPKDHRKTNLNSSVFKSFLGTALLIAWLDTPASILLF